MKNPFILIIGAILLLYILGIKAFWSILVLTISIYLLIFISNYLKQFETGDQDQTSKDFWKYSYDIRKFKKSIWEPKESSKIINKKFYYLHPICSSWDNLFSFYFELGIR